MIVSVTLTAFLACVAFVKADPTPTTPSPGAVYNEGSSCQVGWEVDTTGVWTVMNIELMAGDNFNMQFLTTVATVDGTDASSTSYTYICPDVDPNSEIYFYQFTSPYSDNVYWSGRFTIAGSDGSSIPPAETTVYSGETVAWGSGSVVGVAASAAPAYGESVSAASSAAVTASASASSVFSSVVPSSSVFTFLSSTSASAASLVVANSTSTTVSVSSTETVIVSSTSSSMVTSRAGSSTTATSTVITSTSSPTTTSASGNTSGAGALKIETHVFRTCAALALAAVTFAIAF